MGIAVEFNPDICLRDFSEYTAGRRELAECLPEKLEVGQTYPFLKKDLRNYWLMGEVPLMKTTGNAQLSKPLASIIILEATHFLKDGTPYTKGFYKVTEVFTDDKIHFNSYAKVTQ